jgi:ATP-binding cassette subfamily F protein 3
MVQSKIKLLAKVEVVEKVVEDSSISFRFPPPGVLKPPCLRIDEGDFAYDGSNFILRDINFAVDQDSRISIVGANGAGKSTLLKLLIGKL